MKTLKVTREMQTTVATNSLYIPNNMLSINADAKTVKGEKLGFLTGIMYLEPNTKVCPSATAASCINDCLYSAGRGAFNSVQLARSNKGKLVEMHNEIAMVAIYDSIRKLVVKANNKGLTPVVRLNGTSDIDWTTKLIDGKTLFAHYPDVQFYDYTKRPNIARKAQNIDNYHVTVSYSSAESYAGIVNKFQSMDNNIAVVFDGGLPDTFLDMPVIDGDVSDLRFLDNKETKGRVVVGLKAKGQARGSVSPLVVTLNTIPLLELA